MSYSIQNSSGSFLNRLKKTPVIPIIVAMNPEITEIVIKTE